MKTQSVDTYAFATSIFLVVAKVFKLIEINWLEVFYPMLIFYGFALISLIVISLVFKNNGNGED